MPPKPVVPPLPPRSIESKKLVPKLLPSDTEEEVSAPDPDQYEDMKLSSGLQHGNTISSSSAAVLSGSKASDTALEEYMDMRPFSIPKSQYKKPSSAPATISSETRAEHQLRPLAYLANRERTHSDHPQEETHKYSGQQRNRSASEGTEIKVYFYDDTDAQKFQWVTFMHNILSSVATEDRPSCEEAIRALQTTQTTEFEIIKYMTTLKTALGFNFDAFVKFTPVKGEFVIALFCTHQSLLTPICKLNLRTANLSKLDLTGFNFDHIDLTHTNFTSSVLRLATFKSAKLDHAIFYQALLDSTDMEGVNEVRLSKQQVQGALNLGVQVKLSPSQNVQPSYEDIDIAGEREKSIPHSPFSLTTEYMSDGHESRSGYRSRTSSEVSSKVSLGASQELAQFSKTETIPRSSPIPAPAFKDQRASDTRALQSSSSSTSSRTEYDRLYPRNVAGQKRFVMTQNLPCPQATLTVREYSAAPNQVYFPTEQKKNSTPRISAPTLTNTERDHPVELTARSTDHGEKEFEGVELNQIVAIRIFEKVPKPGLNFLERRSYKKWEGYIKKNFSTLADSQSSNKDYAYAFGKTYNFIKKHDLKNGLNVSYIDKSYMSVTKKGNVFEVKVSYRVRSLKAFPNTIRTISKEELEGLPKDVLRVFDEAT